MSPPVAVSATQTVCLRSVRIAAIWVTRGTIEGGGNTAGLDAMVVVDCGRYGC